jgi:cytochrome c-type biogenesis protein CcmH
VKAALLLAVLALAAAAPAAASERHPTLAELEGEIICPTCHVTLDQSDSPIARRIKQFIAARIAAGDTKSEIKAKLVAQFGEAVLAAPPKHGFNLLAWLLPIAGILAGAAVLAALAWRWSRVRGPTVAALGPPLQPELDRRVDEELARFE